MRPAGVPDPRPAEVPGGAGWSPTGSARLALALYAALVAVLILAPFDFAAPHGLRSAVGEAVDEALHPDRDLLVELLKSSAHAALFFPLAPLLSRAFGLRPESLLGPRAVLAMLGAACLAGATEAAQLTVSRGASLPDFIMDLAGYVAGALALRLHEGWAPARRAFDRLTRPAGLAAVTLAYAIGLYLLLVPRDGVPFRAAGLSGWSPGYPLLVGNERTRTRPWAGTIERLVIRTGHPDLAPLGPPSAAGSSTGSLDSRDALAAYEFRGGELALDADGAVREVRPRRGPALEARRPGARPAPGGGIDLARGALLGSTGDAWRHAVEALRVSGDFTLEVRFRPSTILQGGPARIVSSSWSRRERNFTLGQEGDGLELRVRTPFTGPNGDRVVARAPGCLWPGLPADVVATYSRGVLRLSVNGVERGSARLHLLGWLASKVFHSAVTWRVGLGLAFAFWAVGLVPVWLLLARLGVRSPRSAFLAGLASAAVGIAAVALAAL